MELKKDYTIVMVTHNMQQAQILNLSFLGINISVRLKNLAGNLFILGEVVEFDDTDKLFSMPSDKRTEDYITGRFG